MSVATGVSVKGVQTLIVETEPLYSVAVKVLPSFPIESVYKGFISIEIDNLVDVYQAEGRSLWYQGVLLFLPPELRSIEYRVVANWRVDGLAWEVITYAP